MTGMSVFDLFEDMEVIRVRSGILPGEEIPNGYAGQYCTAPEAPGRYTLHQLVDPDDRTHRGFIFEKEKELNETRKHRACDYPGGGSLARSTSATCSGMDGSNDLKASV